MGIKSQFLLMAVKESKGSYEGRAFDSCKFHLVVDVTDNSSGRSVGCVTREFKFGKGSDIELWLPYDQQMKTGGVLVEVELGMVAGADKAVNLQMLSIKPVHPPATPAPAKK